MNHLFLFLRNSFLHQQAINQWLAIDLSIQFVFFLGIAQPLAQSPPPLMTFPMVSTIKYA